MKRRSLILGAAGATAGGTVANAPAIARSRRNLNMVTCWPKNAPGPGMGAERMARQITEASDGRLRVRVYASGELVPPFEAFDAVSSGTADIYHGVEFYWQGKSKAFNFFCAIPYGLSSQEMAAWVHHGGGQELWDELSGRFNLKPLVAGISTQQMGGWYRKEINGLEDLKGLKVRMPGLGGEILRRIGAVAVAIPGSELFPALQSGAVDAADWGTPWDDMAFGFYKVAKYYYYPGVQEPGTQLSLGINLEVWHSLSEADRRLITMISAAENTIALAQYNAMVPRSLRMLTEQKGVKLRRFSDEILQALGEAANQVLQEIRAEDPLNGRIYDSYMAARRPLKAWTTMAEQDYGRARQLPFAYG